MGPVVVTGLQSLFDQQAAKPRAVDEQLAGNLRPGFQRHGFDEAIGAAQRYVDDLALDAFHATRFGVAAQVLGVQPGVEVVGVGHLRQR